MFLRVISNGKLLIRNLLKDGKLNVGFFWLDMRLPVLDVVVVAVERNRDELQKNLKDLNCSQCIRVNRLLRTFHERWALATDKRFFAEGGQKAEQLCNNPDEKQRLQHSAWDLDGLKLALGHTKNQPVKPWLNPTIKAHRNEQHRHRQRSELKH